MRKTRCYTDMRAHTHTYDALITVIRVRDTWVGCTLSAYVWMLI